MVIAGALPCAGYITRQGRDSCEEAFTEFLTGIPQAEERDCAGYQAGAQEPGAAAGGFPARREAADLRVHAQQKSRHLPLRYPSKYC